MSSKSLTLHAGITADMTFFFISPQHHVWSVHFHSFLPWTCRVLQRHTDTQEQLQFYCLAPLLCVAFQIIKCVNVITEQLTDWLLASKTCRLPSLSLISQDIGIVHVWYLLISDLFTMLTNKTRNIFCLYDSGQTCQTKVKVAAFPDPTGF